MGILDSLFGKSKEEKELMILRQEIESERQLLQNLKAQVTETLTQKESLIQKFKDEALQVARKEELAIRNSISEKNRELQEISLTLKSRQEELIELDEKILLQSFSLYRPTYDFLTSEEYKKALDGIREQQKEMLKDGTAVTGAIDWTVNGSRVKGAKMVRDTQKLLLRAFNSECEYVTWKVKYNNFDSCIKRIENAYNAIQKLGVTMSIEISSEYLELKIKELRLALEYQQMKQREKERQRELRERQREEAALQKELEEARRKVEKEQAHYLNALATAKKQIEIADESDKAALIEKISALETQLVEINEKFAELDRREANQRAGYVYVISNIGSFGEGVYKIGMTRRLNPQERIDELGGASVPFKFDVHAMIFTEDAPKLEAALHHAFENRKLNMVNTRREFFRVELSEIERVVRENFDKSVEFIREADAEQFRESQKLRAGLKFFPD